MRTLLSLVAAAAVSVALTAPAHAAGLEGGDVDASAKFSVKYDGEPAKFSFGQSKIVKSTLQGTPLVPVSLHAADEDDFLREFSLSGRVKKGKQKTSDAVVIGLSVEVGNHSMLLIEDEGDCTLNVKKLTKTRIAGSFTCDTTYADDTVTAKGTFKAS